MDPSFRLTQPPGTRQPAPFLDAAPLFAYKYRHLGFLSPVFRLLPAIFGLPSSISQAFSFCELVLHNTVSLLYSRLFLLPGPEYLKKRDMRNTYNNKM
jgi:hypothetical protein